VRTELARRAKLLGLSLAAVVLTVYSAVLFALVVTALVLIVVWIGIPLLVKEVYFVRGLAALHRHYAGRLLGEHIETPYLRAPEGNLLVGRARSWPTRPTAATSGGCLLTGRSA
jgi:hypothetical protein